nr:hypothetical protein [Tanacetum cinerariifolium]
VCFLSCPSSPFFLLSGYPPFESFTLSLEESDDLNIPDVAPVDPALEAYSLPKFDMHLYKSSLIESHVRYLVKLYGIPEDLHPRVAPEGLSNVWKHAGHAFSLKDSEGKGFKVSVGALLPADTASVTHLASPAERLEDVPPKTGDVITAKIPCRKVLDDKEKKKGKLRRKPRLRDVTLMEVLWVTIAKKVASRLSKVDSRSGIAQGSTIYGTKKQKEEFLILMVITCGIGSGNVDTSFTIEGHGDNVGGLLRLQAWPSPAHHSGRHLDTVEEPAHENVVPEVEASYSVRRFGNPPFTPQWGLTKSSCMDNSRICRDIMSNLSTSADEQFFNEGVRDESDRLKELEEEKKEAGQLNSSQANRIKQLEEAFKQYKADAHQLRVGKECYAVEPGRGEMVSLVVGKGFIDGISIGREDADIQASLRATPNVDHASSDIFMDAYEKIFDQRYPYVDRVARIYLPDSSGLQNIMPDETGPTSAKVLVILQQLPMPR